MEADNLMGMSTPDPKNPGYDVNGNPLTQGVVGGLIQPIVFKDPKQGFGTAVGEALDASGNKLTEEAARKLTEGTP